MLNSLSKKIDKLRWYSRQLRKHKRVLVRCFAITFNVRWQLTFSSHKTVMRWIEKDSGDSHPYKEADPLIVAWSVKQVSRLIPFASCLTQALATKLYFSRMGSDCTINIGVRTEPSGKFFAHAWVLYDGDILLGGDKEDLSRFKLLTEL